MKNIDIQTAYKKYYQSDIDSMKSWVDSMYNSTFSDTFKHVDELYFKLQSKVYTISDSDLEWVLVTLPMQLFEASESLNRFRLEHEVIKLKSKTIRSEIEEQISKEYADIQDPNVSKSEVLAAIKKRVNSEMTEHALIIIAYSKVISRVENQISFCKELIMGCKKIWDSRRRSEESNPVSEPSVELPDYIIPNYSSESGSIPGYDPTMSDTGKTYIR